MLTAHRREEDGNLIQHEATAGDNLSMKRAGMVWL